MSHGDRRTGVALLFAAASTLTVIASAGGPLLVWLGVVRRSRSTPSAG